MAEHQASPEQEQPTPDEALSIEAQAAESRLHAFAIERLSQAFETSAKRWELIVYPSLFAFIILAAYGFYLVFSLAKDVHSLAISVDTNMTSMAGNMRAMSADMQQIRTNIDEIAVSVDSMSQDVETLRPLLTSIQAMDRSMQYMTQSTAAMRGDMAVMNQSISRPLQFMNGFMPW